MGTAKKTPAGDPTPVAGGIPTPSHMLRKGLPAIPADLDDLTKHLLRLLALHPRLALNFRADDITTLTDDDKRSLVRDINDVLGIKPLKVK